MKYKLGIVYGIISWFLIYIIANILNLFINDNIPYVNMAIPISIIITTTFFEILYIRNFNENEVLESFKLGILFFIIDLIFDLIFFIIPNNKNIIVENYSIHLLSMLIIIPLITTFIGYLAQMTIELR